MDQANSIMIAGVDGNLHSPTGLQKQIGVTILTNTRSLILGKRQEGITIGVLIAVGILSANTGKSIGILALNSMDASVLESCLSSIKNINIEATISTDISDIKHCDIQVYSDYTYSNRTEHVLSALTDSDCGKTVVAFSTSDSLVGLPEQTNSFTVYTTDKLRNSINEHI